jgi:phospholipid/cholesterol/gamma-HCH transport system substrate-binding protein
MEHRISYAAIGAFVIVLGGLLAALLIWLAAGGSKQNYNTYAIYMKSGAQSLSRSSEVYFHGVPAGHVMSVTLNPSHPLQAQVLIGVEEGITLKTDTQAKVQSRLTGPSYIELTGGSSNAPVLSAQPGEKYPVISTAPGTVDVVLNSARHIASKLQAVSDRLDDVLSKKNVAAISESLDNIHKISTNMAQYSDELGPILNNLDATLVHARAASSRLPALMVQVQKAVVKYRGLATKIGRAATGVGTASQNLGSLAPDARGLLTQLDQVVDNLNALVRELKRQPNSIIFGKPAHPGPGEKKPSGG